MNATDAREELEAAIWRRGGPELSSQDVMAILDAAEVYADAVADERITGHPAARLAGRDRLAVAMAEKYGKPLTACGTDSALKRHRENGERCEICLAAERDRWAVRAPKRNAARRKQYAAQRDASEDRIAS